MPDRYRTIVADPPWPYGRKWANGSNPSKGFTGGEPLPLAYESMALDDIEALPVMDMIGPEGAHLYLWTTNRFLPDAFRVVKAWGFTYSQLLVWANPAEIERLRVQAADHFVFEHGTFPSAVNVLNEEMVPGLDYKPVHGSLPENKAEDARKARRQAERIDRIKRERGFTDA